MPARDLISHPGNRGAVSAATLWGISIKHDLGRGHMPISGADALRWFEEAGFDLLPVTPHHAALVETLPEHHRDPFDRTLVAQAVREPMGLVTHDGLVARYGHWVIPV